MKPFRLDSTIHRTSNEVYLFDCSVLPNGTHKDLRSSYLMNHLVAAGVKNIHLITAGNAGNSIKQIIEESGEDIYLTNIVDLKIDLNQISNLKGNRSCIKKVDLGTIFLSQEIIELLVPAGSLDITYFESGQYDSLIKAAIKLNPTHILIPVGSGELYNCFYNYISQRNIPVILIGILPKGNHPLSTQKRTEKTLADKLGCKYMNVAAKSKIEESLSKNNFLHEVSNEDVLQGHNIAAEAGLDLEFSGSISLSRLEGFKNRKLVCILTGKGG